MYTCGEAICFIGNMFVRRTEIVQLLLLYCIVAQSYPLTNKVGSSLMQSKTESELTTEEAVADTTNHRMRRQTSRERDWRNWLNLFTWLLSDTTDNQRGEKKTDDKESQLLRMEFDIDSQNDKISMANFDAEDISKNEDSFNCKGIFIFTLLCLELDPIPIKLTMKMGRINESLNIDSMPMKQVETISKGKNVRTKRLVHNPDSYVELELKRNTELAMRHIHLTNYSII
ncbi:uncharacterized protein LOC105427632 [Pogonomyrmex barbatus]|uniref:Uncharacterized protein LOC105427632 n=1 Tax=Pogonomyrmex barbatus TaxID=144034 RepID=A0A6I9W6U7_9HYME|nr:uncharacterized protein LOC105427632 [Pogonomyrmex barbatus]